MRIDPLKYFYKKYDCDNSEIKRIEVGERFIAIVLHNKNLGVCARYDGEITNSLSQFDNLNLDYPPHRTLLTAYYNAKFNCGTDYKEGANIIKDIEEGKYSKVVMIGYFSTLIKKFNDRKINLAVFDFLVDEEPVIPMKFQKEYLQRADAVIMTSTSILNGTFAELIECTNPNADVYIIGPSSILGKEFFQIANIKKIHGAVFNQEDENVINMIKDGAIPKEFLKYGKKVSICP